VIAGVFYGYTGVLGHHVLWIDILIFFVGVAAGQGVSCVILRSKPMRKSLNVIGLVMLLVLAGAFAAFTFAPPEAARFEDRAGRTHLVTKANNGRSAQAFNSGLKKMVGKGIM
jgi:hypothetical protein